MEQSRSEITNIVNNIFTEITENGEKSSSLTNGLPGVAMFLYNYSLINKNSYAKVEYEKSMDQSIEILK